jgi:protein gp37
MTKIQWATKTWNPDWARYLKYQCESSGTPFFFKQMSKKQPIPDDLMIREFPKGGGE